MKLIIAVIQPHKLEAVKRELSAREIYRLTVIDAHGYGRQMGQIEHFRGLEYQANLIPKVELQIAVNDNFVKPTIEAIQAGAKDEEGGQVGDGKIIILPIEDVIRISDGESGSGAV